jgi:hypothetical protein
MILDTTQRRWALDSLVFFLLSTIIYAIYAASEPSGPRGGSTVGLIFGVVGFAFMWFAALLGARKRVPTWRLGRAQAWMRGHLWLGLLSLPLILFHAGFHSGGVLTRVLMWLLIATVASGLFGAALQNYIPRRMTSDVPLETIYDEIKNVRKSLRTEADSTVESLCGPLELGINSQEEAIRAGGFSALRPIAAGSVPLRTSYAVSAGASAAVAAAQERILLSEEESAPLKHFYLSEMRAYLENPKRRGQRLADTNKARNAFAALKTLLPATAVPALRDLEGICEESRQFVQQERLHHWLHGWLLVHIPLSLVLMLLGTVHAVVALRY